MCMAARAFSEMKDEREPWRVVYPLREVLFLVVCATIANCDDYEDIVDWGEAHLDFLRRFSDFHHGVPCADWLRALMNRVDPELFQACFRAWVAESFPDRLDLVAIDGKTSRRSHDRAAGKAPLHLVSAFATDTKLVLGQEAVAEKANEIVAIPRLLERLDLEGALVSIDAMGCNPEIAQAILDADADYLLAVKDNQPTLHAEVEAYFDTAPAAEIDVAETLDKGHGRLEIRIHKVSKAIDWISSERAYPGAKRFPKLAVIAMVEARVERKGAGLGRAPLLHLLPHALGGSLRRGRAQPLGDRERPALGPRRDLQGGPQPPPHRPRRGEHGGGTPFRPQPRASGQGQACHQAPPQNGCLGPDVSRRNPRGTPALTRTRCPGAAMGR